MTDDMSTTPPTEEIGIYSTAPSHAGVGGGEPGFDDVDIEDEKSGEDAPGNTTGDPVSGPGGQIAPREGANLAADQQDAADASQQMADEGGLLRDGDEGARTDGFNG